MTDRGVQSLETPWLSGLLPGPELRRTAGAATGRAVVLFRTESRLHLGSALAIVRPLERLADDRFPRTALFMDFGLGGRDASSLTESCLDRLACLPDGPPPVVTTATAIPAIARLAAVVAASLGPQEITAAVDSRSWFREILLAAGLLATRATHAVVEADAAAQGELAGLPALALRRRGDAPAAELALARKLVARIERLLPGACPLPGPLLSGLPAFLALDGSGPMGASPRGTLYVSDPPDVVARKIRSAKTDGGSILDPEQDLSPEVRSLLLLLHAVADEPMACLIERCAGKGYSYLKGELAAAVNAFLAPIRARRALLDADAAALAARVAEAGRELDRSATALADELCRRPEVLAA